MSRRDTIIVAVLVNAGLLIVLFASALKSNAPGEEFAAAPTPVVQEAALAFKKETSPMGGDEVDHALLQSRQNTVAAHLSANQGQEGVLPEPAPVAPGFADDLKAIAAAEAPTAPQAQNPSVQTLMVPVPPPARTAPEFVEVKVKKGDVLEKIARHHHSSVAEIMKANKLTSTNLRIGQVLKVPVKSLRKAETATVSWSASTQDLQSEGGAKFYTVVKGDSPWTIAVKNHLKVEDLLKLNNMNEDQARRLKPGDKIRIH
jgi:LysM repeat protein